MPYLLLLLFPLLTYFAWNQHAYSSLSYVFIFTAFIPLFYCLKQNWNKAIGISLLFTIILASNLLLSAWMWSSVPKATFFTSFINAFFQTLILLPVFWIKKEQFKMPLFILLWLLGEFMSGQIAILAPYNNLYFSLSSAPYLIQYISFSGSWLASGVILLINYTIYLWWIEKNTKRALYFGSLPLILSISSIVIFFLPDDIQERHLNVGLYQTQNNYYLSEYQSQGALVWDEYLGNINTKDLDLILLNESAVINDGYLSRLNQSESSKKIRAKLTQDQSDAMVLYGSIAFDPYQARSGAEKPSYVSETQGAYYTTHNIAVGITQNQVQYRMKEIFVPFQEQVPYEWMADIRSYFDIQGIAAQTSYKEKGQSIIQHNGVKILPLLCYESLFSNLQSQWDEDEYDILAILANEQWNEGGLAVGNLQNGVINAILHRKPTLRISNKGVDGYIDGKGRVQWCGFASEKDHLKLLKIAY